MRLERVSTAKNRFYITLDCDKRLKVQRLVLVAVMRVNGQVFVSGDAHFPPPSSKRGASPRLKGRAGPYETLLSFADSLHDDDSRSPRSNLASTGSSPPVSSRRRASSLKSTSTNSSPRSTSSSDVNSWQTLVQWLLESRHASGALLLQHLAQLSSIAIDFGTHALNTQMGPRTPSSDAGSSISVESIRQELLTWLESGPTHIMDLLEGGFLSQCIPEPWFLGNISQAGAQAYLHWYVQRANLMHAFLVRFSSPVSPTDTPIVPFPHLVIEALWTNEQTGAQERYSAPIVFEHDQQGVITYWIETANDAGPSRSSSLVEVIRYTCNTTGWPHVWRNPPPTHPGAVAMAPHPSYAGSPGGTSTTSDGIAFHKPRSMPLLHSPSRAAAFSNVGTPPLSRNGSSNLLPGAGAARSPMLVLPSRLGILPHDPAVSSMDTSISEGDAKFAGGWTGSQPRPSTNFSLSQSQSDTMDNVSSESTASTPHEKPASATAMQEDAESFSSARAESSFSEMPSQDFDYSNSGTMGGPNSSSMNVEPSMMPPMAFQPIPSDYISARSMSAPTALRTWNTMPQHAMNFNGNLIDGSPSPTPYYLNHAAPHHFGAPRFMAPPVSFPYSQDGSMNAVEPNNFQFNPSLHLAQNFGSSQPGHQQ